MTNGRGIGRLQLGEYYIASVEALWSVAKAHPDTDSQSPLVADIERLIAKQNKSWSDVYALERLIVPFMPELEVTAFFQRRLARAKSLSLASFSAHQANWEAAKVEKHPDERLQAKQAAYTVLLDDLNWFNTAQRLDRAQRDRAAHTLWRVGLFSRLNSFQASVASLTYADISRTFKLRYLMVRFGFGMVGAAILYFLMAGGFVEGSLFPDLRKTGFDGHDVTVWGTTLQALVPNADFAKLVVWSFIGGFSERFVSSSLERIETNAAAAENKQDD